MLRLNLFILNISWLVLTTSARGLPASYQVNIREGCRQAVAGGYLQAYDERERVTAYIATLKQQISELKTASDKAEVEAKKAAAALASHTFDTELAAKNDTEATVAKSLNDQWKDYQNLLEHAQAELPAAVAKEKKLHDQIVKVFNLERGEEKADGGYPIKITYRSSCPKYRALCPLPREYWDNLLDIVIDGAIPEPCRRYVDQSHLR